ncbi:MAG: inositol monophosphatase [Oscillospiraceae bacterium]|nr:inositol monophosphatase [Oscillospiraceae bacterium]
MLSNSDILAAVERAERSAAELILHAHGILAETKTGRRDVVTEYDRRVQALLVDLLGNTVPDAGFYCEEMENRAQPDAAKLFIIDPIDGTMNFVHGLHHSCVSVAYAEHGEVLVGAVYNPYTDEMFTAIRGEGARLNGAPIHVAQGGLAENIVCFGTAPYNAGLADRTFSLARGLFDASLDLRREGSAALDLCTVAAGRAGLYFELQVALWDYAAGALLVREAGGVCSRADGSPFPTDGGKTSIVAGTREAVGEFLAIP